MVPTEKGGVWVCSHLFKYVVASPFGLAIGAEDMQVLIQTGTATAWKQFWISQLPSGAAYHAPFDEFGAIPQAAYFCLPSAFAISLIRSILYYARAFQDRAGEPSDITLQHRFYTAVRRETPRLVIESFIDKLIAS